MAGGQINLLIRNPRRREMIGIIDWRLSELERLGVEIRYDIYAEEDDVLSLNPDLVLRQVGQVVLEHGTAANADLFLALKPLSRN